MPSAFPCLPFLLTPSGLAFFLLTPFPPFRSFPSVPLFLSLAVPCKSLPYSLAYLCMTFLSSSHDCHFSLYFSPFPESLPPLLPAPTSLSFCPCLPLPYSPLCPLVISPTLICKPHCSVPPSPCLPLPYSPLCLSGWSVCEQPPDLGQRDDGVPQRLTDTHGPAGLLLPHQLLHLPPPGLRLPLAGLPRPPLPGRHPQRAREGRETAGMWWPGWGQGGCGLAVPCSLESDFFVSSLFSFLSCVLVPVYFPFLSFSFFLSLFLSIFLSVLVRNTAWVFDTPD